MIFVESIPPFQEDISPKKRRKSSRKKKRWRGGRGGVRDGEATKVSCKQERREMEIERKKKRKTREEKFSSAKSCAEAAKN